MMLCALSAWHAGHSQIVIVGDGEPARALSAEVARHYLPFALAIPVMTAIPREKLAALLPFTQAMTAPEGGAAYVCRDFTCKQPVTRAQELELELTAD